MAAVLITACAAAVLAPSVTAMTSRNGQAAARATRRLCSTFFSSTQIEAITGLTNRPDGKPVALGARAYPFWRVSAAGAPVVGNIPGSLCNWLDTNPPWGQGSLLQNTAFVTVGYGESMQNWRKLRSAYQAGKLFHSLPISRYSPLNLGHRTQAFADTVDLWAYYGVGAGSAPGGFPHYLYGVTVLTRHHNILQVAFMNVSVARTEQLAIAAVKNPF